MPGSGTIICDHYELPAEVRVVGQSLWGPVVRARDVRTKQLVAVKVFDGIAAFREGTAPGRCTSPRDARRRALRDFESNVACLQRLSWDKHETTSTVAAAAVSSDDEDAGGAEDINIYRSGDDDGKWGAAESGQLPACPAAVVELLAYSHDEAMRPAPAADGRAYLVLELGELTLAQYAETRPADAEVRETVRSLFAALAELHRCGLVLSRYSPHDFFRFRGEWKIGAPTALRPVGHKHRLPPPPQHRARPSEAAHDDAWRYIAPEHAAQLLASWPLSARSSSARAPVAVAVSLSTGMDVWALSLLCLELATRTSITGTTYETTPLPVYLKWLSEQPGPLPLPAGAASAGGAAAASSLLHSFAHEALQREPSKRLDALGVLEHAWLKDAVDRRKRYGVDVPISVSSDEPLAYAAAATQQHPQQRQQQHPQQHPQQRPQPAYKARGGVGGHRLAGGGAVGSTPPSLQAYDVTKPVKESAEHLKQSAPVSRPGAVNASAKSPPRGRVGNRAGRPNPNRPRMPTLGGEAPGGWLHGGSSHGRPHASKAPPLAPPSTIAFWSEPAPAAPPPKPQRRQPVATPMSSSTPSSPPLGEGAAAVPATRPSEVDARPFRGGESDAAASKAMASACQAAASAAASAAEAAAAAVKAARESNAAAASSAANGSAVRGRSRTPSSVLRTPPRSEERDLGAEETSPSASPAAPSGSSGGRSAGGRGGSSARVRALLASQGLHLEDSEWSAANTRVREAREAAAREAARAAEAEAEAEEAARKEAEALEAARSLSARAKAARAAAERAAASRTFAADEEGHAADGIADRHLSPLSGGGADDTSEKREVADLRRQLDALQSAIATTSPTTTTTPSKATAMREAAGATNAAQAAEARARAAEAAEARANEAAKVALAKEARAAEAAAAAEDVAAALRHECDSLRSAAQEASEGRSEAMRQAARLEEELCVRSSKLQMAVCEAEARAEESSERARALQEKVDELGSCAMAAVPRTEEASVAASAAHEVAVAEAISSAVSEAVMLSESELKIVRLQLKMAEVAAEQASEEAARLTDRLGATVNRADAELLEASKERVRLAAEMRCLAAEIGQEESEVQHAKSSQAQSSLEEKGAGKLLSTYKADNRRLRMQLRQLLRQASGGGGGGARAALFPSCKCTRWRTRRRRRRRRVRRRSWRSTHTRARSRLKSCAASWRRRRRRSTKRMSCRCSCAARRRRRRGVRLRRRRRP